MKESELFEPVKNLVIEMGCSNVYGEVMSCDVLGIKGACNIIVEMKTTLSFKVIDQAIERLRYGHYVYIAVPKRKAATPKCVKEMLASYHIGLIEVGKRQTKVAIPAKFNRLANKRKGYLRIRESIKSFNESQVGGVKSGEGITDYALTINRIKDYMVSKRGKWVTVEDILKHCETHYQNPKPSVMATLKAEWNQDWCETKIEQRRRYFRIKTDKDIK